jgi:gliding motility-associated-like protein
MYQRFKHIIFILLFLSGTGIALAQTAMPDTVCIGTRRTYSVNSPAVPSTYTWKVDGVLQTSTTNALSILWNTAGVYTLTVQEHPQNGCDGDIRSGTVYVNPVPVPNAGSDITACFGKDIRLDGSGSINYQWTPSIYLSNPSAPNPNVVLAPPGTYQYYLTVSDANGCKSVKQDSVIVKITAAPKIFAGRDTAIAINQPLQLNVIDINNVGFVSYSWSPASTLNNPRIANPMAITDRDVTYVVTVRTAEGCQAGDDIKVTVFQQADIYVPTAFTPNGDGRNDFAKAIPVGIREFRYFMIYNRWGETIFTTKDPSKGWDGKLAGVLQDNAVFVWMAQGVDFKGNLISKKGTITLIK